MVFSSSLLSKSVNDIINPKFMVCMDPKTYSNYVKQTDIPSEGTNKSYRPNGFFLFQLFQVHYSRLFRLWSQTVSAHLNANET